MLVYMTLIQFRAKLIESWSLTFANVETKQHFWGLN
jgi:hypothetical protein